MSVCIQADTFYETWSRDFDGEPSHQLFPDYFIATYSAHSRVRFIIYPLEFVGLTFQTSELYSCGFDWRTSSVRSFEIIHADYLRMIQ